MVTTFIFLSHPLGPFFSEHKKEQRAVARKGVGGWLELGGDG